MRIVLDMNLSPALVAVLAPHVEDAVHWSSVGEPTASDASIMAWARSDDRIVLTHDLDFAAMLAATGAEGPSVLQIRTQDVSPAALADLLLAALAGHAADLRAGALVVVDAARTRVRVLPLWGRDRE